MTKQNDPKEAAPIDDEAELAQQAQAADADAAREPTYVLQGGEPAHIDLTAARRARGGD